jgi:hypothetical protein
LSFAAREFVVESNYTHILFSGTLLGFNQASRPVDTDNQTTCDFRVESAAVSSLVYAQNSLDPRDDFVAGRVGGLVEVDDAG